MPNLTGGRSAPVMTAKTPGSARARVVSMRPDARVGVGAAQQLAVGHARQDQVVGVAGLPGDLGPGVDLGERLADDGELGGALSLTGRRLPSRPEPAAMRSAASSTASRIFV